MPGSENATLERLQPLLHPASMAVIGASARAHRPGLAVIRAALSYGFDGPIYPVTPNYEEIEGITCFADLAEAPGPVDLAVIAGAAERAPAFLESAVSAGARAALIFATLSHEKQGGVSAVERVGALAAEAGIPLLGSGSIGYVNYPASRAATWVPPEPAHITPGSIALIIQSGALYCYCNNTDPRLRNCFTIHPGQEAGLGTAEILEYALAMPQTRVIGLYLETVRDPDRFAAALSLADAKGVPVVVLKPGRSARAADAIATHAGRLAGDDRIFDALFRRHGVVRVETTDELYSTVLLFSKVGVPGPGGLAAVTDSGGQRSLLLDAAERRGLPLADFRDATRARLRQVLAPDLPDNNPIDMWGGEEDIVEHVGTCLDIALDDPDTALAAVFTELGSSNTDIFVECFAQAGIAAAQRADKPVIAMTFSSRHFYPDNLRLLDDAGIAVLDGVQASVAAITNLLGRRERARDSAGSAPKLTGEVEARVRAACSGGEFEALALLRAAGVATADCFAAETIEGVQAAFEKIDGPVALKTAAGHLHKGDVGGVVLNLKTSDKVAAAYAEMAGRLGPEVTVAAMALKGVEAAIGAVGATPFGPAVMFGAGGTLVEVLDDVTFELAPLDRATALAMIGRTKVSALLSGVRGSEACDVDALCDAIVRVSQLIAAAPDVAEIDVNPVIVTETGCIAVDAVVRGLDPR